MMKDSGSTYWRGPRADALQARYRQLISGKTAAVSRTDEALREPRSRSDRDWAQSPHGQHVRGLLKEDSTVSEPSAKMWPKPWEPAGAEPGTPEEARAEMGRAQGTAKAITAALSPEDGNLLIATFDRLPSGCQRAMLSVLAKPAPGWSRHADAGEISAINGDRGLLGAELLRHWGAQGARKLGIALSSFNEARDRMSAASRAAFDRFWKNDLSPREPCGSLGSRANLLRERGIWYTSTGTTTARSSAIMLAAGLADKGLIVNNQSSTPFVIAFDGNAASATHGLVVAANSYYEFHHRSIPVHAVNVFCASAVAYSVSYQ